MLQFLMTLGMGMLAIILLYSSLMLFEIWMKYLGTAIKEKAKVKTQIEPFWIGVIFMICVTAITATLFAVGTIVLILF